MCELIAWYMGKDSNDCRALTGPADLLLLTCIGLVGSKALNHSGCGRKHQ